MTRIILYPSKMGNPIGRPRTCTCGECSKCRHRDRARERWQSLSLEERRAVIAKRDKDKSLAADRARYYRHLEQRRSRMKEWSTKNKDRANELKRKWANENPEKRKASWAVNNAIRDGNLVRQPCEVCGVSGKRDSGRSLVHAHHDDYSKPLEVRWLCDTHHNEHHRKYPVPA